jgi:hypothetical protein
VSCSLANTARAGVAGRFAVPARNALVVQQTAALHVGDGRVREQQLARRQAAAQRPAPGRPGCEKT